MLQLDRVDDLDDVGCEYSNSTGPWRCLVRMSKLLFEGRNMFELEYLVNQIEEPVILADHLPSGFLNKGKRSARRKKLDFKPFLSEHVSLEDFREKSGLKLIFKVNLRSVSGVVCTQPPIPTKITFKKCSSMNPNKSPRKRTNSEEEGTESTKRAKKSEVPMDPAPDLPEAFKNYIRVCEGDSESVILVIQKELTKTDLSKSHCRLSVPYRKIRNEFLKPSEVERLNTDKEGMKTTLIQPCLEERPISLRNWKSNREYVLVKDWNQVCSTNALTEGMKIQLWSFRKIPSDQLCFALVRVD